jgi:hypothetical protein
MVARAGGRVMTTNDTAARELGDALPSPDEATEILQMD